MPAVDLIDPNIEAYIEWASTEHFCDQAHRLRAVDSVLAVGHDTSE